MLTVINAEYHYAECHYSECHFCECPGAAYMHYSRTISTQFLTCFIPAISSHSTKELQGLSLISYFSHVGILVRPEHSLVVHVTLLHSENTRKCY
jgi:hypothetical protein